MKRAKRYENAYVADDYFAEIEDERLKKTAELKRRQDFLNEIREDLENLQFAWSEDLSDGEHIVLTETARRLAFLSVLKRYREVFLCGRPY